jgi:hypothetical protein
MTLDSFSFVIPHDLSRTTLIVIFHQHISTFLAPFNVQLLALLALAYRRLSFFFFTYVQLHYA